MRTKIIIALLIKVSLFFYLINVKEVFDTTPITLYQCSGDCFSYIEPVENFIKTGSYSMFNKPYSGRMPSIGIPYYLLRTTFEQHTSLNLLVLLQLLLDVIACVYLFKITYLLTNNKILSNYVFLFYCLSSYITVFNYQILTESLAVSLLILSLYTLLKHQSTNKKYVLLSGTFLILCAFLRPFLILFIPLFMLYIYITNNHFKTILSSCLLFVLPSILLLSVWTARNYYTSGKVIVLQSDKYAGYTYEKSFLALRDLVTAWGGDIISWNPNAEIRVIDIYAGRSRTIIDTYDTTNLSLPNTIYTTQYNYDSLMVLKKNIKDLYLTTDANEFKRKDSLIAATIERYTNSFKSEQKLYYIFQSRVKLLYKFLFHSGTYNISAQTFSSQSILGKSIKIFWSLQYLFIVTFSLIALFFLPKFILKKDYTFILLYSLAFFSIIIFPLYFRFVEYRYLATSFPFMLILALFSFKSIINESTFKTLKNWFYKNNAK